MAADTQAYLGQGLPGHARKMKVHKLESGAIVGITSNTVGASTLLLEWINAGLDPQYKEPMKFPDSFEILIVYPSRHIHYYNDGMFPTIIEADYMAIGSGVKYALGALAAGLDAEQAVSIACHFDQFSGGGVTAVRL